MTYDLVFEIKDNFFWVTATGTRSLKSVLAITKEILAACTEHEISKVLIDVRALEGRLSTASAFTIPTRHFPKFRDRSLINHVAIIDLKGFELSHRFFEKAAASRGFKLRIFSDPDKAVFWLNK